MSGKTISYDEYEGMFNDKKMMKISTVFYIECAEKKYKASTSWCTFENGLCIIIRITE